MKWLTVIVGFFYISTAISQPVSFSLQNDVLHPVSGYTGYSDCVVDMDDNHLDDVVRVGNKGLYIDFQQANGSYKQRFFPLAMQYVPDWSIAAGDLDNDGYNDLLFGNAVSASFVHAKTNGTSYVESVFPQFIFSQRTTFADIDNDGWLDAFVCNDTAQSIPFHNLGSGIMVPDTNLIHTANRPGNYGAIWTDYDLDNDIDLYISKCQAGAFPGNINRTNLLYRNEGAGVFTEVAHDAGVDDNAQSWSTSFEDFDNDGDFDAFVVNHDFENRLYRNNGDGTFTDVITASGINHLDLMALDNATGDFNNDGFMDIFADLQKELYLGNGDLTFTAQDAPVSMGGIGDLNNDGFLDVFHNGSAWINEGNTNHYIKIIPVGNQSNRNGIGTRVEIFGAWGKQTREVRSGQSFSPMNSLTVHFGLSQNDHVDSLILFWPSGIVTTLRDLSADTLYVIGEGYCVLPGETLSLQGPVFLCHGDSIEIEAPAGFAQYIWSNGEQGLSLTIKETGQYSARLIDSSGCVALTNSLLVELRTDTVPVIAAAEGNTICQGDSLLLLASQGNNYEWSNGKAGVDEIYVTEAGNYTVSIDAVCTNDRLTSRFFEVRVLEALPPIATGVEILPGDSVLLNAVGENCQWYDQPVGGNLLATGCSFQTMPLSTSQTYFVESHSFYPGELQSGGKSDTTGQGGVAEQAGYLTFEVWEPFTLLSVTAFIPDSGILGTRFVQLWSGDSVLAFKSFVMHPGANVLELNFNVPVGHYTLRCQQGLLWRSTGVLQYPYPIGDAGAIISSSFGDEYYYFFYDWKIKKADHECISARTPVQVTITADHIPVEESCHAIFPNPTTEIIYFESSCTGQEYSIQLLDATGSKILMQTIQHGGTTQLDLSALPKGIYCIILRENGKREIKRVIKI